MQHSASFAVTVTAHPLAKQEFRVSDIKCPLQDSCTCNYPALLLCEKMIRLHKAAQADDAVA